MTMKAVMRGVREELAAAPSDRVHWRVRIALVLYLGGREVVATNKVIEGERVDYYKSAKWVSAVQDVAAHPTKRLPPEPEFKDPNHGLTQGGLMAFVYLLNALARTAGDIGGIVKFERAGARRRPEDLRRNP